MHFRWNDNSCEIVFSKKERKLVKEKGIVTIDYRDGRNFVNVLARIVGEIHVKYKESNGGLGSKSNYDENLISNDDAKVRLK
jgi:hypothetical protein|tara:strand:- start:895 stop:1140 length:246 start_codon:yes stop_codon:yes gene_type:complete